jgi:ribosomal protein S18 acetylase RimI-like enzyme
MCKVKIRKAIEDDAAGIVKVNTYTWLTTYNGLIPKEVLEKKVQTMSENVIRTRHSLREKSNRYVATIDEKIVGIMSYGKSRNENYANAGEIYSIYVLEECQGCGIGSQLFIKGLQLLFDEGFDDMILNCLEGNPSIKFYEKFGGFKVGTKKDMFDNVELQEDILYFSNIKKIINNKKKSIADTF